MCVCVFLYTYIHILCTYLFFLISRKKPYAPFFAFLYRRELKMSFPFDRKKSSPGWNHRLLARRELSKFPINPITYKRARSHHNRCSLWRFDWTLIKHSLSTAMASIPHWKVGHDRRYWFREYYHGLEKRRMFWGADGGGCDLPFEKRSRGGRISGSPMSCRLITPSSPSSFSLSLSFSLTLTLDIIYSLFLLCSPSFYPFSAFITIPWISRWARIAALDGFAVIPWMRICEFRTDAKHSASDRICAIRNFKS